MQLPLQVIFRNCPQSSSILELVEKKAKNLEHYFPRIIGCRVVIEVPHQHQHKGNLYRVFVDLTLPGNEIIVGRNPTLHEAHQDVFVAIRDSFRAARRQLQDRVRKRRTHSKRVNEGMDHGRVIQLSAEGYGFIQGADGREVYFHRNSVLNGQFDRLVVGEEVTFSEEMGNEGAQATTVHLIGKAGQHVFW